MPNKKQVRAFNLTSENIAYLKELKYLSDIKYSDYINKLLDDDRKVGKLIKDIKEVK